MDVVGIIAGVKSGAWIWNGKTCLLWSQKQVIRLASGRSLDSLLASEQHNKNKRPSQDSTLYSGIAAIAVFRLVLQDYNSCQ
jgi:hypothetical protein